MRTGNVVLGLILIAAGILVLLENLNYVRFDWDVVWRLWPLILVYLGLRGIFEYVGV